MTALLALALALASGAATKNATCEIIVSLVGRRRCQIHTDTQAHKYTHTHTLHTYRHAEVVVVAVFVAVNLPPRILCQLCQGSLAAQLTLLMALMMAKGQQQQWQHEQQ